MYKSRISILLTPQNSLPTQIKTGLEKHLWNDGLGFRFARVTRP